MGVNTAVVTTPPFTLCVWGRTFSTAEQQVFSICDATPASLQWFSMTINNATAGDVCILVISTVSGIDQVRANVRNGPGRWFHLLGIWNATNDRSLYYNGGVVVGSTVNILNPTPVGRTAVGCLWDGGGGPRVFMQGQLAYPAAWSVSLSSWEIQALAQGADPITIRRQSLVETWDDFGRGRVDARQSMTTVLGRPMSSKVLRQDLDGLRANRTYGTRRALKVG